MRGWPEEVIAWLRENVPGRTTKQVTELINQQGFDKKYEMVFSDAAIKGAKNRYGIKSGTTGGVPKGYSLKYPEGMESYIRSIATGRKTKEIAELVSAHFGIEFSEKQCKAYKKNHDIISGVDCRFEKGHVPANKGKPMSQPDFCGRIGFPDYMLANNNANIRRLEGRIKSLQKTKSQGTRESENKFFKVKENVEAMRIQLFFEGKPEPEVRDILKSNGFRWAPSVGAWQRQLNNNGKYAVERVIRELEEMEAAE